MANVVFNRKQFEKEIGKLDEKMQNKISMFGTPLEKFDNNEIEIEIFPNRPDLLSYHGFKRAFLAFLGKQKGLKEYKANKPEKDYTVIIDNSVSGIRPYTACAIVKGLELDNEKIKEIVDIQEKLHLTIGRKRKKMAIGIYPLEKIKLPITFKALEPDKIKFIPLESDREMSGLQILQRHAAGKEYSHLLAGKAKFPVFTDSGNNILSMPPIINSQLMGKVTRETRDVFVECSGFDFSLLEKCLNIIVTSLSDMGGKIYQMNLHYNKDRKITPNLSPDKMRINLESANSLLGTEIHERQLKELLEKMGHNYNQGIVSIPCWRTDILHEVDLIEDAAIAYGYENFTPEIPKISTTGKEERKEVIKRKIAEILVALNMLEVSNYHLTSKEEQFKKMSMPEESAIRVESSKTEYNLLRKDLSHYLMKNLSENVDSEYPQRIFEIGKIFNQTGVGGERFHDIASKSGVKSRVWGDGGGKEFPIHEEEHLSLAISPANFTELRQILEYLSRMLGIEIKVSDLEKLPNYFIDGRTAEIKLDSKPIGFLGEIHPKILKNWKIKMPMSIFEINLEEVFRRLN